MKDYEPNIPDYAYRLGATEELRAALTSMGFRFANPHISRGCHWGEVYFFDENLELAKSLMDEKDHHFRIDTKTRYFYLSPCDLEVGSKWQFSVQPNKIREYKPIRRKHGPYHK